MNPDSETGTRPQRQRPPRLRSRLRQVTCDAILTAAEETLGERGLHDAGMVEIAARAGVSVGTLYNHFKDRDALLTELLRSRRAELFGRLDEAAVAHEGAPFRAQLGAFSRAFFEHVDAHRRLLQVVFGEEKLRGLPSPGKESPSADLRRRLEKLMKLGMREGVLPKDSAGLYGSIFMGMLRGAMVHDTEARDAGRGAALSPDTVVRFFLEGAGSRT